MSLSLTAVPGSGCVRFYICISNKINVLACPTGLLFDSVVRKCNYAVNVKCSDTTTTALPTTTTTKSNLKN